jgi:hypothetical protein
MGTAESEDSRMSTWREKRVDHALLEDQMCSYTGLPGAESPDVLDAMVYGITEILVDTPISGGMLMVNPEDENEIDPGSGWF